MLVYILLFQLLTVDEFMIYCWEIVIGCWWRLAKCTMLYNWAWAPLRKDSDTLVIHRCTHRLPHDNRCEAKEATSVILLSQDDNSPLHICREVVGIATGYGLYGPGIESRWGRKFSVPVQARPEAHLASCTIGTGVFLGLKRPGRDADHPPVLAPRLQMGWNYTSAFSLCLHRHVMRWSKEPWLWLCLLRMIIIFTSCLLLIG